MRGATSTGRVCCYKYQFLLTRLMRGATLSLRKEKPKPEISTHAPHARRDPTCSLRMSHEMLFLLTRLMRGATIPDATEYKTIFNFYSRASCEARQRCSFKQGTENSFLLTRLMRGATATFSMHDSSRSHKSTRGGHLLSQKDYIIKFSAKNMPAF